VVRAPHCLRLGNQGPSPINATAANQRAMGAASSSEADPFYVISQKSFLVRQRLSQRPHVLDGL
jgi:hypothetical protein